MKKLNLAFLITLLALSRVDAQSGNIGIATVTPNSRLQVDGSISMAYRIATGTTTLNDNDYSVEFKGSSGDSILLPDATACKGRMYLIKNTSSVAGTVAKVFPTGGQTIDGNTGYWPIYEINEVVTYISNGSNWQVYAQKTPVMKTDVSGSEWLQGGNINTQAGDKKFGTRSNDDLPIITNNTERMRITKSGKIGIGTATPTADLELAGTLKIVSGTPGAGKVLTSDASGVATWQNAVTSSGATGATGVTGATGSAGTNGTNGATGATGAAGTNGTNGATGATGATGAAGSMGATGVRGATGATGVTGATGTAGTNGTNGATGATGATGTAGTNGTNGTNGATGATGATGAAGTNGATGATGATGLGYSVGSATGNTPYWNGTTWVANSNNIYNAGTSIGMGTSTFNATHPEKLLVDAGSTNSVNAIVGKASINSYVQLNIQNSSSGTEASSDVVATANNGSESANYIDMGINGGGYTGGVMGEANDAYLFNIGQDLLIGTGTAAKSLVLMTGGTTQSSNERMRIDGSGNVGIGTTSPAARLDVAGTFKLGTSGSALTNIIKTNVTITDNTSFNYTVTREVSVTVTGAAVNATVIVNPRAALPTGFSVGYAYVSGANTIKIGFTNSDATSRALGSSKVFDITVIN